jgi:hypothetical protein
MKNADIVRDYVKHKEELDELCRRYGWAYEIRKDGSARIIRTLDDLI